MLISFLDKKGEEMMTDSFFLPFLLSLREKANCMLFNILNSSREEKETRDSRTETTQHNCLP
jgi:hypothetical protein